MAKHLKLAEFFHEAMRFVCFRIAAVFRSAGLRNDEEIYQRARRIVGAEMQNIVYGEYLPIILGQQAQNIYGLRVDQLSVYDPSLNPSIRNAFATAAFR